MAHLSNEAIGYISVLGAIIFFGSCGVPLKLKRVQEAKVDPVVYQLYYSIAIFISSWLVLIFAKFEFTYFGIIGASLWVPASALSLFAINYAGLSVAVGVWAGVTIIVSFLWGAVAFPHDHPIGNIGLSVLGLILLVIGIVGLSLSNFPLIKGKSKSSNKTINSEESSSIPNEESALLHNNHNNNTEQQEDNGPNGAKLVKGIICALGVGLLNGSIMVPMRYAPGSAGGLGYAASFGIGAIIVTPVLVILYTLIINRGKMPVFAPKAALGPGLLSGVLWSAGNVSSILATKYLGMTVGYPLTQVCLVVSGLWGIIVFREISGARSLSVWGIALLILGGGVALLALFGSRSK